MEASISLRQDRIGGHLTLPDESSLETDRVRSNHKEPGEIVNPNSGTPKSGQARLSGKELERRIVGRMVRGDYLGGFTFAASIDRNGTIEGRNNVGVHDSGRWSIDLEDGSFTVRWDGGWDNTTTYACDVGEEIRFFDRDTSQWRTTFTACEDDSPPQIGVGASPATRRDRQP